MCEYAGLLLTDREADAEGKALGDEYLFDLDMHINRKGTQHGSTCGEGKDDEFVINAKHIGNVGRFINHSCSPNSTYAYQFSGASASCSRAQGAGGALVVRASRPIAQGEELGEVKGPRTVLGELKSVTLFQPSTTRSRSLPPRGISLSAAVRT